MLNGLRTDPHIDVYVTGSNSKLLSSDVATEFRGRGKIIHATPLSVAEALFIVFRIRPWTASGRTSNGAPRDGERVGVKAVEVAPGVKNGAIANRVAVGLP